jgi:hypothetical protein
VSASVGSEGGGGALARSLAGDGGHAVDLAADICDSAGVAHASVTYAVVDGLGACDGKHGGGGEAVILPVVRTEATVLRQIGAP